MSIVAIVIVLLVVGFILWIVNQAPIDGTIKNIIYGVVVLGVIIWLLQSFGLVGHIGTPVIK